MPKHDRVIPVIHYASPVQTTLHYDRSYPGIAALVFFFPVLSQVYAIGFGLIALKQPRGSADRICGFVGLGIAAIGVVFWCRIALECAGIRW